MTDEPRFKAWAARARIRLEEVDGNPFADKWLTTMSAAEARELAAALIVAADNADKQRPVPCPNCGEPDNVVPNYGEIDFMDAEGLKILPGATPLCCLGCNHDWRGRYS